MFLASPFSRGRMALMTFSQRIIVVIVLATGALACAGNQKCAYNDYTVTLPVYDQRGSPLPYTVASILPAKYMGKEKDDPGWLKRSGFSPRILGTRVDHLAAGDYTVVFSGPKGEEEVRSIIVFHSCRQRISHVVVVDPKPGFIGDSSQMLVRGSLAGCDFSGDWWVRLTPLHGQAQSSWEGVVNGSGAFEVPGHFNTALHSLIVGSGSNIVLASEVTLSTHRDIIDIGRIEISRCLQ